MDAVSLFSGVGGFDMGFERAGIRTVLQAENDPWCLQVLARHWPDVERVTDVRQVDATALQGRCRDMVGDGACANGEWLGSAPRSAAGADLVYGGFPCQDVSVAGNRAGLGGARSGLWSEFARVLRELRPTWLCVENVPGLLSSNRGRDFGTILGNLDDLGYGVAWAILDARYFGVPQRRRRVFLVGCLGNPDGADAVLAVCESGCGHPAPSGGKREDVAFTLAGGSPETSRRISNAWNTTYLAAFGGNNTSGALDLAEARSSRANRYDFESDTFAVHTEGVRRLTPLECERLMGWPDGWTQYTADGKEIPDSHRYRLCGNGVVSTVAEWIGHRLMAVDRMLL